MNEIEALKRRVMKLESIIETMYDELVQNKLYCPICDNEVRLFLPADGGGKEVRRNSMCPVCGSDERSRFIYKLWEIRKTFSPNVEGKIKFLHFAPEKVFVDYFGSRSNIDYYPCDINENVYGVKHVVDATDIPFDDNTFDVIMFSNIIEHIEDEQSALKELYRVLKPNGVAFIDAPVFYNLDKTIENLDFINTPELQKEFYGWPGHVRKYGKDYKSRLESAGFIVEEICIDVIEKTQRQKYGLCGNKFANNYRIHSCTKL